MESNYTYIQDIAKSLTIPEQGILTQTLYQDKNVKVVLFGFSAGEELSQHTSSMPAILHVIQGEIDLTLGKDSMQAQAGVWVHMPPHLQHSIYARTPVMLLLQLIKQEHSERRKDSSE